MTLWSDGATAIAPTDEMFELSSEMLRHVPPASVVFHTPPATVPMKNVRGSMGSPVTATARPPRKGPTSRHCMPRRIGSDLDPAAESGAGMAAGFAPALDFGLFCAREGWVTARASAVA